MEYTLDELIKMIEEASVDGKISFEKLGAIVFDINFPDALFENALKNIIDARDDDQKMKEISTILVQALSTIYKMQQELVNLMQTDGNLDNIHALKQNITKLEERISPMEKTFFEIKNRIDKRKGD